MMQADLDDLRQQVRNLADRVARLEASSPVRPEAPLTQEAGPPHDTPSEVQGVGTAFFPVPQSTPILPVLGGATLGLAGAYLLRAIAESGVIPSRLVFAVAALYAVAWLLWAARSHTGRRLAAILYSLTAVLILSPLLWEATVRFHTVSPWQTSVILVAFNLIGLTVSWRKDLVVVATISTVAGIGTAAALLVATCDVLPFTFAFLAIAAAIETCACFNHWQFSWPLGWSPIRAAFRKPMHPFRLRGCSPPRLRCWPSTSPALWLEPSCETALLRPSKLHNV
jgi:hypothetical protein